MRYVKAQDRVSIPIGRQGENEVETVQFDVSGWSELYGNGSYQLLHQRKGDEYPYPCVITLNGDTVNWVIESADVVNVGYGEAQLSYIVDSAIAHSVIFTTYTGKSLDGGEEVPEPYESWVQSVLQAGTNAAESADESQAWAIGAVDGVPVSDTADQYHNNSKYFSEQAADSATEAGRAESAAYGSAGTALSSSFYAEQNALKSEGFAVGEQDGELVGSESPYYNNNAKHYAQVAQQGAETSGYVFFDVNDEDGCMYVTTAGHIGEDVTFEVNEETGELEVVYT